MVNILEDMPIDTTNLAYIRCAELEKELIDKLNKLEYRIDKTETEKKSEKKLDDANTSKDKYFLYGISYFLVLIPFFASLIINIILVIINDSTYLSTNMISVIGTGITLTFKTFLLLLIGIVCIGSLVLPIWMYKIFMDHYFYGVLIPLSEDSNDFILKDFKRELWRIKR